jgi:hypothetical protein
VTDVARLIADLDSPDTTTAEEAQASLIALGDAALPAVVEALPGLGTYGKRCAIEVLDAGEYAPAGPALVALLDDVDDVAREWSAALLGRLGHRPAVPALRAAYARLLADGTPLGWTEPAAVRDALTAFGARRVVRPPLLAALAEDHEGYEVFPATRLADVLAALADASQVVLFFQVWRRAGGTLRWQGHEGSGWELDRALPWAESVRAAYEAALLEASCLPADRPDLVVGIEWIDAADTRPL